jgi:hypothetical protein
LAANADALSQEASVVGIGNEGISLIQQVGCLVDAGRLHQKITQPAHSL